MVVAASAQDWDKSYGTRFMGPEIWRLPPVKEFPALTPSLGPTASCATPSALNVPRYEMPRAPAPPPAPPPEPPVEPPLVEAPLAEPPADDVPAPSDVPVEEETAPPEPKKEKIWSGNVDLGVDGSEGNTEVFNLRCSMKAVRKVDISTTTLSLSYSRQTSKTIATQERLYFDGRYEQLLGGSRWSAFFHQTIEYDQFQPFDVRDTSDIGFGYRLIDRENTTLIGRFGGGFSHEYGGPNDGEYVPEAVFGMQFEHQLNKMQKFIGSVEYAPDVTQFSRYRIRSQAALEIVLSEERNLSMRIGVLNRYNNEPNNARPNDLDYAMMLMWKF